MSRLYFPLLFAVAVLTAFGCNDDEDEQTEPDFCNQTAFMEVITTNGAEIGAAATVFGDDPSTENCNAYRVALETYLTELRRFDACPTISSQQSFTVTVSGVEMSINNLPCS